MSIATRKNTFTKAILEHVGMIPGGSKAYRAYLERTALLIVDELARLGLLPFHPKFLKSTAISKIVYSWKSEKLSQKTLANRLAVLRKIANTTTPPLFEIPSNQTFNIKLPESRKVLTDTTLTLNPYNIQNQDVQRICLLQYLFGLTKLEAIRSFELLVTPETLIVPRKISFNKIERRIIINNSEQLKLVTSIKTHPLINSTKALSILHNDILKQSNIKENEYFRLFYIINRYKQLRLSVPKKEALKQVQQETGYTSLRQLKGLLSCLEDF